MTKETFPIALRSACAEEMSDLLPRIEASCARIGQEKGAVSLSALLGAVDPSGEGVWAPHPDLQTKKDRRFG